MAWGLDRSVKEDESKYGLKKMGNRGLKVMFGIGKSVASQAVNSGRTLVVSFQRLHLVLEGRGCGKRKKNKR